MRSLGALFLSLALATSLKPRIRCPRRSPTCARSSTGSLTAYGGRAALEGIHAYRMEGQVVAAERQGPLSRVFERPGRLRVEIRYPERTETRIVNGGQGWRGQGTNVASANGAMLDAMVLQAARADLPWFLLQHASDAHAIAPLDHDGASLAGIEVPLERGLSLRAYVDSTSGRIAVSQSRMVQEGGRETLFETDYSDFPQGRPRPVRVPRERFRLGTADRNDHD